MIKKCLVKEISKKNFIETINIENTIIDLSILKDITIKNELFESFWSVYHSKIDLFIKIINLSDHDTLYNLKTCSEFSFIHFLTRLKRPEYYGSRIKETTINKNHSDFIPINIQEKFNIAIKECQKLSNFEFYSSFLFDVVDFEPNIFLSRINNLIDTKPFISSLENIFVLDLNDACNLFIDKINKELEILGFLFFVVLSTSINSISYKILH